MQAIVWTSDLHLDHAAPEARPALAATLRSSPGKAVIATGDLSVARYLARDLEFVALAAARPCYFVLGNHDHFGAGVAAVRDIATGITARHPGIHWLPPAGVVPLTPDLALVGVDGWADGRAGDPSATPLRLNDDRLIAELASQPGRAGKLAVKRVLADADAARLEVLLERAAGVATRIVIATHIPPFAEALPDTGRLASPDWLPLLVCGATGAVLRRAAAAHPDHHFTVLCGHTHVARDVMILPNLRCCVAGARYGAPSVIALEL